MEQVPAFLARKREITNRYNEVFKNFHGVFLQKAEKDVVSNNWLYTVRLLNQAKVRKFLLEKDVEVRPLWVPMNQLPAFKNDIYINKQNVSDKLYKNCLSLPCSTGLLKEEQQEVINLLQNFYHD
jgi:dTDP-4-amino-4,6-dideoxygalactose transaminase